MPKILFITHNDLDGMGCYYAAAKWHGDTKFETIVLNSGAPIPDVTGYDIVYITDFTISRIDCNRLIAAGNKRIVIIDHHAGSKWAATTGLPGVTALWDDKQSGAVLTWRYFFSTVGSPVPKVLQYVQDRDLYTNQLPKTREIAAYMRTFPKKVYLIVELFDTLERDGFQDAIKIGSYLLDQTQAYVKGIASQHDIIALGSLSGGDDILYAILQSSILASELGEYLLEENHGLAFVAIWSESKGPEKSIKVELRAAVRADSTGKRSIYPITRLAVNGGGGGHQGNGAAGFTIVNERGSIYGTRGIVARRITNLHLSSNVQLALKLE